MVDDKTNVDSLIYQISTKKPDLLEIRMDKLEDRRILGQIFARKPSPLIATDRSDRDPSTKRERLIYAAGLGFEFIDLDLSNADTATVRQLKSKGARIILSFHDYSRTPSANELTKVVKSLTARGSDICKIVTTARLPRDNLTILGFLAKEVAHAKLVSFAMGSLGVPSRILSPWFGAEFTFAALSSDSTTAEGQLTIEQLRGAWQALGL